jgi:hypothetical protein
MTAPTPLQFRYCPIQELPPSRLLSEEATKIIAQVLSPNTEDRRFAIQRMWDLGIFPTVMPTAFCQILMSHQDQALPPEHIPKILKEFMVGVAHFLEGLLSKDGKSPFDAFAFYKTCADSLRAVTQVDIGE